MFNTPKDLAVFNTPKNIKKLERFKNYKKSNKNREMVGMIKAILKNGYVYRGELLEKTDKHLIIKDKISGDKVTIAIDYIISLEEK